MSANVEDNQWNKDIEESDEPDEPYENTESERSQADTIFETILDMKEMGLLSQRKLNLQNLAETLLKRYQLDGLDHALGLIRARSGYILEMMDNAHMSTFDWSRKSIYKELKAAQTSGDVQVIRATPLNPRSQGPEEVSSVEDDKEDESEDEVPVPKNRKRRVRKSLLRPKLSSVSAKGTGKGTAKPTVEDPDSGSDSDLDMASDKPWFNEETPSKSRGQQLVQEALSAKINGRNRSILSESDAPSSTKTPLQENIESIKSSHNSDTSAPAEEIESELPPDTWLCSVKDCGKIIYKASTKRSKELILDHSLVHAEDTQSKLDLVFSEQRQNVNASVSHLLSKIRDFGAMQEGHREDSEDPSEKRIKI